MDTAGVAAVVAIVVVQNRVVVQIDGHLQPRYLWSGKALAATASIQYRLIFGRLFRTHARRQAGKHTGFMHPYSVWRENMWEKKLTNDLPLADATHAKRSLRVVTEDHVLSDGKQSCGTERLLDVWTVHSEARQR